MKCRANELDFDGVGQKRYILKLEFGDYAAGSGYGVKDQKGSSRNFECVVLRQAEERNTEARSAEP